MPKSYLDSAYRRFLNGRYSQRGFTTYRMYVDACGNSFLSIACYYCGDMANTEDHTLPLVALQALFASGDIPPADKLVKVPACLDCNVSLGTKVFPTLYERKEYIKSRLRKRFAKELRMPLWHKEEIEALGPTLRSAIEQGIARQYKIRERLAW